MHSACNLLCILLLLLPSLLLLRVQNRHSLWHAYVPRNLQITRLRSQSERSAVRLRNLASLFTSYRFTQSFLRVPVGPFPFYTELFLPAFSLLAEHAPAFLIPFFASESGSNTLFVK